MKSIYSLFLIILLGLGSSKSSAQLPSYFRLDSISKLSTISNIMEQANYYYIVNYNFVFKLEKSTGIFDTIYNNSNELIASSFIDSSGNVGIQTGNIIKLYQAGVWQNITIVPTTLTTYSLMVDGAGHICFYTAGDTLLKYNGTNWTKQKLVFPNIGNYGEYLKGLLPGPNHECRIKTFNGSFINIYEMQGNNLLLKNQIPSPYVSSDLQYDSSGRLWYLYNSTIYNTTATGVITTFVPPISNNLKFTINKTGTKLWLNKNYGNDLLYYFDGSIWHLISDDLHGGINVIFKVNNDQIVYFNINSLYNYNTYYLQQILALHVFNDNIPINYYNLLEPFINSETTAIAVDNSYINSSWISKYFLGSENGLIQVYNDFLSKRTWDTTNSALTTNHILSLAPRLNQIIIGTDNGLFIASLDADSLNILQHFTTQNSNLPNDTITSIAIMGAELNNTGDIWVGTNHSGAAKINQNGNIVTFDMSNSLLPSNHINHIDIGNSNPYDVYLETDSGFLAIDDTIQHPYTPSNSAMINGNISSVCNPDGFLNITPKFIVGSIGGGFAIVSNANQWEHYNTQNFNFNTDTVYFISDGDEHVSWNSLIIGTNDGLKQVYDQNGINFENMQVKGQGDDKRNYHKASFLLGCEGGAGRRFGSLSNKGISSFERCIGATRDLSKKQSDHLHAWFNGTQLHVDMPFKGPAMVELYNLTGQKIMSQSIASSKDTQVFSTPILHSGIYILRVFNNTESKSVKLNYSE
jgi:hypothetical protein